MVGGPYIIWYVNLALVIDLIFTSSPPWMVKALLGQSVDEVFDHVPQRGRPKPSFLAVLCRDFDNKIELGVT